MKDDWDQTKEPDLTSKTRETSKGLGSGSHISYTDGWQEKEERTSSVLSAKNNIRVILS